MIPILVSISLFASGTVTEVNPMAIRYVKDFEFPSAAGYSDSKPSKVTGQMLAKGGPAKSDKAPKGLMVMIGIGKPKHDAPAAHKKGGKVEKVMHEFGQGKLHSGSKKGPKVTNPKQAVAIALNQSRKAKKGGMQYDDNGPDTSVPVKDIKSGKIPQSTDEDFYGMSKNAPMPPRRPSMMKKGGMQHEDAAQDKAMIKSMVKPAALKKAMGGDVQMAKSNAIAQSLKGQKKTGYADGGMVSPLQQMAMQRARAVPVAPRAPMVPPQAAMMARAPMAPQGAMQGMPPAAMQGTPAAGGQRIGVGRARPGQPDVGAIRAALARAGSQAMPENAPGMMKKGGKVKC